MVIPNSIIHQTQSGQQSNSSFQLALASSGGNSFTTIRDGIKTIAKPTTIQQQQVQAINKMQGIVFNCNTIPLQQTQLQAKLQRQSSQSNISNTINPLTRTIQRTHKIQLTQAPPPNIIQGDK